MKEVEDGRVSTGQLPPPSEGWRSFVVDEATKFTQVVSKEKGESYDVVSATFKVTEGEEEGRRLWHTYFLSSADGRKDFANLIGVSKAAPTIEKNYKITDDLTPAEWGEKYLNPESEKCRKLIEGSVGVLIGRNFDGKVIVKRDKKTGQDKAYLNEVTMYGKGKDTGEKKGGKKTSSEPAGAPPEAASDDDGGWG